MALKIVKYVDKKKGHRWSIRSRNGKVIADGAESYTTVGMRDKGLKVLLEAIHKGDFKIMDEAPAAKPGLVKKTKSLKAANSGAMASGTL